MAAKVVKASNYSSMPQTEVFSNGAKQKVMVSLISMLVYINSSTGDFVHDDIPGMCIFFDFEKVVPTIFRCPLLVRAPLVETWVFSHN